MFNRQGIYDGMAGSKAKPKKEREWTLKITREQLLEMRAKHEFEGWKPRQCAAHYGLDKMTTYRYLNYITAKDVIPKRPE